MDDSPAVAGASGSGAKRPAGKRGPASTSENAKALEKLLEPCIGILTDLVEWRLQAPGLAMTEAEAHAIAGPAARLSAPALAKSKIGKRLLKVAGEGEDAVQLLTALAVYAERVAPIAAERISENRAQAQARKAALSVASNGKVPTYAPGKPTATPRRNTGDAANAASASASAAAAGESSSGTGAGAAIPIVGIGDVASAFQPAASGVIEIYPGGIRPAFG